MNKHKFLLPSGIECEITEMLGKHQRILTQNNNQSFVDKLNNVLSDIIVRVGDQKTFDDNFLKDMLACDRAKILVELRQFSLGFESHYTFDYEYQDKEHKKQVEKIRIDLEGGTFPVNNVDFGDAEINTYADVIKNKVVNLSLGDKQVRFTMLDGYSDIRGLNIKEKDVSSHTMFHLRNIVYLQKTEKDTVPIKLDLDKLSIREIGILTKKIKEVEGNVNTKLEFPNPLDKDKLIFTDALSRVDFFFPEGVLS